MARSLSCSTLASLFTLVILVFLPVTSWCKKEETYKSIVKQKAECCVGEDAELKSFDDIDYDSFVSLMGRRSAAEPNSYKSPPMLRRRYKDHVLTELLGLKKGISFRCPEEYLHTKSRFINRGRQRSQRVL